MLFICHNDIAILRANPNMPKKGASNQRLEEHVFNLHIYLFNNNVNIIIINSQWFSLSITNASAAVLTCDILYKIQAKISTGSDIPEHWLYDYYDFNFHFHQYYWVIRCSSAHQWLHSNVMLYTFNHRNIIVYFYIYISILIVIIIIIYWIVKFIHYLNFIEHFFLISLNWIFQCLKLQFLDAPFKFYHTFIFIIQHQK